MYKKFNKITITIFLAVTLILLVSLTTSAQTTMRRLDADHIEIKLNDENLDSIKILQVTDLHIGSRGHWRDDLNSFNRIKKLVETYNPNILFVTGDLFTGEKPYGSLLAAYAVHFFDELERPWFYTYGNHDPEGGFGRDEIYDVFKTSKWGVLGFHKEKNIKKYDYYVDIKVGDQEIPNWQVYAFDSGPHDGVKAVLKNQIDWYKSTSNECKEKYSKTVNALSIFHIPLIEYENLWNDASIKKSGVSEEKVFYEKDDGSLFNALVEVGNVKATFCGHDHYNNYWGKTKEGIILAYGYISGESTNEAWPTGGKLITIPINGSKVNMKNVVPVFNRNDHKY